MTKVHSLGDRVYTYTMSEDGMSCLKMPGTIKTRKTTETLNEKGQYETTYTYFIAFNFGSNISNGVWRTHSSVWVD